MRLCHRGPPGGEGLEYGYPSRSFIFFFIPLLRVTERRHETTGTLMYNGPPQVPGRARARVVVRRPPGHDQLRQAVSGLERRPGPEEAGGLVPSAWASARRVGQKGAHQPQLHLQLQRGPREVRVCVCHASYVPRTWCGTFASAYKNMYSTPTTTRSCCSSRRCNAHLSVKTVETGTEIRKSVKRRVACSAPLYFKQNHPDSLKCCAEGVGDDVVLVVDWVPFQKRTGMCFVPRQYLMCCLLLCCLLVAGSRASRRAEPRSRYQQTPSSWRRWPRSRPQRRSFLCCSGSTGARWGHIPGCSRVTCWLRGSTRFAVL